VAAGSLGRQEGDLAAAKLDKGLKIHSRKVLWYKAVRMFPLDKQTLLYDFLSICYQLRSSFREQSRRANKNIDTDMTMSTRAASALLWTVFAVLANAAYTTDTYTMISSGRLTTVTDTYFANYYDSAVPTSTVESWCGSGASSVAASFCISEVASSLDIYSTGCPFESVVSL
jgi:hypothetical protein